MVDSIGWIRAWEEISKILKICLILEPWTNLEEEEMTSQTELNVSSSFSTWFCPFQSKLFIPLFWNTFSNLPNTALNSIKLWTVWPKVLSNFGTRLKWPFFLPLLNSITFSTWENFPEFSKEFVSQKRYYFKWKHSWI